MRIISVIIIFLCSVALSIDETSQHRVLTTPPLLSKSYMESNSNNSQVVFTEQSRKKYQNIVVEDPERLTYKERQKALEDVDQLDKKKMWQLNAGLYIEGSGGDNNKFRDDSSDDEGKRFWFLQHEDLINVSPNDVVSLNLDNNTSPYMFKEYEDWGEKIVDDFENDSIPSHNPTNMIMILIACVTYCLLICRF